jgi:hypothetical protein
VGNCIGEKNHAYFLGYLLFLSLLTLLSVYGCYIYISQVPVVMNDPQLALLPIPVAKKCFCL